MKSYLNLLFFLLIIIFVQIQKVVALYKVKSDKTKDAISIDNIKTGTLIILFKSNFKIEPKWNFKL